MRRLFGKEWFEKLLGIDTFFGRMKFHHRLKRAIALALASGALIGYLQKAEAATPEQEKTSIRIGSAYAKARETGDSATMIRCETEARKLMYELMRTFKEELQAGELDNAERTVMILRSWSAGLNMREWWKRLDDAKDTVMTLKKNKVFNKVWAEALASAHRLKKEGRKVETFELSMTGSNWYFKMTHGYDTKENDVILNIQGDAINLVEIERHLKKIKISDDQKNHVRAVILRTLLRKHEKVKIMAK